MQSERIILNNDGAGLEEALDLTTKFAEEQKLNRKDGIHLRLLGEELFGMVRAVTNKFSAEYWIERTDGLVTLYLEAETEMDLEKKLSLVELSSRCKNEAAKGLMGKIRDIFEFVLFPPTTAADMYQVAQMQANSMTMMGSYMGALATDYIWSLEQYRYDVRDAGEETEAKEAWDELEKSVVANLADDVRVWVKGNRARLVIEKKISG